MDGADAFEGAAAGAAKPPTTPQARPQRFGSRTVTSTASSIRNLTPGKVSAALVSADNGDPSVLFSLLDEVEDRDLHLVAVLGTRKRAVANLAWEIEPATERRRDRKIAEQLTELVEQIANFEDGLVDLLDAVSKGVAFAELPWEQRGGLWMVPQLDYRPQRWFRPDEDDPTVWRVLEMGHSSGMEMDPGRFIVHRSRAKAGVDVKAGLGRVLLWWYLFKSYAVKDWVSFLELFGAPLRVGKVPPGASESDIDDLYTALTQLGISATAVVPDGFDVQLVEAKGAGASAGTGPHEALIKMVERGMSKAVLGQTLTTEEGSNGARALGQVHNEVRQDLVESDAKQLAATLTSQLLAPMVRFNWGTDVLVPRFVFDTEPPADGKAVAETQKVRAEVFQRAINMGVPVPLAQVLEELGIEEARDGDEVLQSASVKSEDAGSQDDMAEPPSGPAEQVEAGGGPVSTPSSVAAGSAAGATPRPGGVHVHVNRNAAPWGASQGVVCGLHGVAFSADDPLQRQAEDLLGQYRAGVTGAWGELVKVIREGLVATGSPAAAQARFEALISELDLDDLAGELADATLHAELAGRLQAMTGDGSQAVQGLPRVPPEKAIDFWLDKGVVSQEAFYALAGEHRARAFTMARFTTLGGLQAAWDGIRAALEDGETLGEFEERLERAWRREGLAPDKPWRVENAYRNNVFTALSVGRDRVQTSPDAKRRRPYGRYNHVDGLNGRVNHIAMDGRVYHLDDPMWKIWGTPNGHGCRCYRTAHTATEVAQNRWEISSELPLDLGTGKPVMPDEGWRVNPALEPYEYDESAFPESWRDALKELR